MHSELKGEELVFFKPMNPPKDLLPMNPLDFHIRYSPHYYDDENIKKFVIPIQNKFHDSLFPEMAQQLSLGGISLTSVIPGNTIRKVYLSHANIKDLPPGSLIFFYRSSPAQHITTIGIVESADRLTDVESLAAAIGKRSVYSNEEVKMMIGKEVLVINFRLACHREAGVHFSALSKAGILNGPPQTIMELPHNRYLDLKKLWQSPS